MVHNKLIQERKVEPLTFQQLRKLERIDAKKERDAKLIELGKTVIQAGGQTAEGLFAGLGLVGQGYLSGDALAFGVKTAAGAVFLAWLVTNYPGFARFFHLDHLTFGPNASPPPPGTPPPGSTGPGGSFCVTVRYVGPYGPIEQPEMCFSTAAQRDSTADYYSNHTAGNFIIVSEKG